MKVEYIKQMRALGYDKKLALEAYDILSGLLEEKANNMRVGACFRPFPYMSVVKKRRKSVRKYNVHTGQFHDIPEKNVVIVRVML